MEFVDDDAMLSLLRFKRGMVCTPQLCFFWNRIPVDYFVRLSTCVHACEYNWLTRWRLSPRKLCACVLVRRSQGVRIYHMVTRRHLNGGGSRHAGRGIPRKANLSAVVFDTRRERVPGM